MPVTTNAEPAPDADRTDSLVVALTFRGAVFLGADAVTSAQLSDRVKAQLNTHPGNRTYLKVDTRTPYSSVAEVLDALRTAGVNAPILLAALFDDSTDGSYVSPKGLQVLLAPAPDAASSITLKVGNSQAMDTELKQYAQRDRPVVLQADAETPFGDVVHAVDLCRAAKVQVFPSTPGQRQ
jgi:biopolymer transport protein ExbD